MTTIGLSVKVVGSESDSLHIQVPSLESTTVSELKQLIEQQDASRFPAVAQRLIFQGQVLQDDKSLTDYRLEDGCTMHLTISKAKIPTQSTSTSSTPIQSSSTPSNDNLTRIRQLLQQMQSASNYSTAIQTLYKICDNIIKNPNEEKYRKLRLGNQALQNRLLSAAGARDIIQVLGFEEGVEADHVVLIPSADKWENLVACKRIVDEFHQSSTSSSSAPSFATPNAPSMPGMASDWTSQMQTMLDNPMMLQSLQNNPMVRNNPMLSQALSNPDMLRQSMDMIQRDPNMQQRMQQMMTDPNAMAQMQQMMGGAPPAGGFNPFASSGSASSTSESENPFASTGGSVVSNTSTQASNTSTQATTSTTNEDDGTFDDDEVAEAIARSMREQ